MKFALTGNPNSGKTTLYNGLTGGNESVGNWAGVTVAKKEGNLKTSIHQGVRIVDLPGAYSLSPFTLEESLTRDVVVQENMDVIINIVDATNLSRSLFFTTQLLELGIPVVVALNKQDLLKKKGITIDVNALSKQLQCPVIETTAIQSAGGYKELIAASVKVANTKQSAPFKESVDLKNPDAVKQADAKRYEFVKTIVSKVEGRSVESKKQTRQDAIDRIVANPVLGILIFIGVMYCVFNISQIYVGPYIADYLAVWIENFTQWVAGVLGEGVSPVLSAILIDGILGGVGAVIGFLPLIMVLFFLLALLEDSGYMARVALVMDRFFKVVGLSGRSIIPMIIGTGCAIPGVMATRTIRNERERRTTAMLTPFMPCGAKLPVIALFAGAFFPGQAWVNTAVYFVGIFLIIVGALLIVRITGEKNKRSFFIMELPDYKIPSLKRATISMLQRGKAFVVKAATIILLCNMIVQIMSTFTWSFEVVAEGAADTSILASIAHPFAVILIPLGFGAWQLAAAAITGFIAKENVVGTLAVVYAIPSFIDTEELAIIGDAGESIAEVMGISSIAALAYLMFNLYTPPCFAAIGAMNAEMNSKKWVFSAIGLQLATGYVVSFLVYQVGTLVTTGALGTGFVPGLIVVIALFVVLVVLLQRGKKLEATA